MTEITARTDADNAIPGLDLPDETMLTEYLTQTEIWSSASGPMRISDMDPVYRRRAVEFLIRNALTLFQLWLMEQYVTASEEPSLGEKLRWASTRPYSWLKRTPLFTALADGLPLELIRRNSGE